MSLLIVGTGALACLFAARMAGAKYQVTMLGSWPAGLAALRSHGVSLHDLDGSTRNYPVAVLEGLSCEGNFRQALVLVKAWQTEQAATQLKECLAKDGLALTLQNGLGNAEM